MPEIKHNFTGGKMNKDLDERLVKNGEYRDAMNVQVSTSDDSDVGTVQNLLSNYKISPNDQNSIISTNKECIGAIADEANDAIYWFVRSTEDTVSTSNIIMNEALNVAQDGYFNTVFVGGSIIEYKNNIVEPVVIEGGNCIISLANFYQVSNQTQAGPQLSTYFQTGTSQISFLQIGMVLSQIDIIDPSYQAGQAPNITGTIDYSNGATYTPLAVLGGPSPTQATATEPPVVTGFTTNTGAFSLDYTPDSLIQAAQAGSIIALTFKQVDAELYRPPLNFQPDTIITGINIIDDMLFWTDNYNEPKKINISRCKAGTEKISTNPDAYSYTKLINERTGITLDNNIPLEEKHITVIRKPPSKAPILDLKTGRDYSGVNNTLPQVYTGVVTVTPDQSPNANDIDDIIDSNVSFNPTPFDFSGINIDDIITIRIDEDIYGNSNFQLVNGWEVGASIVFKEFDELAGGIPEPPPIPITNYRIKGEITSIPSTPVASPGNPIIVELRISSISGFPPVADPVLGERKYAVDLFESYERLFEFKFPRFATRYKYSDGEYSTYSPFTQVAFIPGTFDYHPKKGYNLGMTNKITSIDVKNFRLNDTPLDVVEIDILYKEDASPNVYVVDTIKKDSPNPYWDNDLFTITHETVKATLPANQLLRTWDNVPKKALAQEVSGSRIIYGNYTQGWNVFDSIGNPFSPTFKWNIIDEDHILSWKQNQTNAVKSIKSLREYQIGVVFIDEHGRETPIISNPTGTFEIDYTQAPNANRIQVGFGGALPVNQKYYKFYIKETSGEYYNLAMDRWFDAEDGNVWLSFASSDRNKLDIDTFLMLKKSGESNEPVDAKARYKVLAIENEAPDYVRTKITNIVSSRHNNAAAEPVFNSNTMTNNPQASFDTFEMNFNHFNSTSGNKLHEIEDGELYVSFGTTGSSVTSKEYRIASITTNAFDDPANPPASPKYFVKLDEQLGDDVNFISDDPLGQNQNEIIDNAVVNIFKHKVENLPIFDGKFFVKIYKDDIFRNYITEDSSSTANFRKVASRKIYSMRDNHEVTHSENATGHGTDVNGSNDGGGDSAYGRPFGRYASYFRLYNYGNTEWTDDNLFDPDETNYSDLAESKYRFHSPGNNGTFSVINSRADVPWVREFTTYTGYDKDSVGYVDSTNVYIGVNSPYNSAASNYLDDNKPADNFARDNEVWFLDLHKYQSNVTASNNDLNWTIIPAVNQNISSPTPIAGGAVNGSTTWHHFRLTLGPIFKPESHGTDSAQSQAAIGSNSIFASTLDPNNSLYVKELYAVGTGNPNYNDVTTTAFTDRLAPGSIWRWAEDPIETKYNLSGQVTERNILRYYAGETNTNYIEDKANSTVGAAGNILMEAVGDGDAYVHFQAAQLSTNFNKRWQWIQTHDQKQLDWLPADVGGIQGDIGPIENGKETELTTSTISSLAPYGNNVTPNGTTAGGDGVVSDGIDQFFVYVTQTSYESAEDQYGKPCRVGPGYVVKTYNNGSADISLDTSTSKPFLVVRKVEVGFIVDGVNAVKLFLTGYVEALDLNHVITPANNTTIVFAQGTMNGYSPNSAQRISIQKSSTGKGAFTDNTDTGCSSFSTNLLFAVGYTMEFIEPFYDRELPPENPAIWETEPKDNPDLDIYFEASDLIPVEIDTNTSSGFLPLQNELIGSLGLQVGTFENCTIQSASSSSFTIPVGTQIISSEGNNLILDFSFSSAVQVLSTDKVHITKPDGTVFTTNVEAIFDTSANVINGIRIDKNTWTSTHTLNWHNCYTFFNGVESNRIRDNFNLPFISNGVRASSTIDETIQEEQRKYGLIFSGIYNSISSVNNLNQFIQAEKITKEINPIYGSIQKLYSRSTADGDLITLCEDRVLKILATKDAVFNADGNPQLIANEKVLGQAMPFAGEYGISKNPESFASESYRSYFTDKQRGAVIRLSKDGLTAISDHGMKDWFRDNLKLSDKLIGSYDDKKDEYNIALKPNYVVSFKEDVRGWVSFKSFINMEQGISMASNYFTFYEGKIYMHHMENAPTHPYNNFYGVPFPSTIQVLLNDMPGIVKTFKTASYEGSQAKVSKNLNDNQYYNLFDKSGWYLNTISTDMQKGENVEFIGKENKWFNYLKGTEEIEINDSDDFAYQGIGLVSNLQLKQVTSTTAGTSQPLIQI